MDTNLIYRGDCHSVLKRNFSENSVDLIYMDPPFSFDPSYARLWYDQSAFKIFEDLSRGGVMFFVRWLSKRLEQCHRVLKETGSMYLHCDQKFGHYLKVEMDNIFGRKNFRNEIIWHYKTGGVSKKWFSRKHDNLFFYTKGSEYTFNPQMEKSYLAHKYGFSNIEIKEDERGLYRDVFVRDVWDIPALRGNQQEVSGYLTQKPETLLERIIKASSNPGDVVLDPTCGCGTTIVVAHNLGREWVGIDISSQACDVMRERMKGLEGLVDVEIRGLPLGVKDLKDLSAFEFQDYICDMTNSSKRKHVSDMGIDGLYLGEIPLQIKQQEKVGRKIIDEFETALNRKSKNKGFVIAFSFTKGAYEEAARAESDGLSIELLSVEELIQKDFELENF